MCSPLRAGRGALRVRLTAWYVLLLGLTLLLFSIYLVLRLEQSLLAQVDAALQSVVSQALANLDEEGGRPVLQDPENAQAVARHLAQTDFAVRLIALDGTIWDGFGDYPALPESRPAAPGYVTVMGNAARWRVYSQPIQTLSGHAGWLQAAQSLAPVDQALQSLRTQALLGLPLVLLLAGLGGLFLADRALRPIDRITRTAQAISANDLSQRIGYTGPADEVGRLATTFDRMLDRLQAAFQRERRFTADAAHELRTPLTALKGRIGVTLSRPRTRTEYQSTLRDLEQEVDRLTRLSTDLLFLARLDQGRLPLRLERLDFSDLLAAIIEQARPLAEAKGVTLTEDVPPGLSLHGDPDHLIRLFLNLLDNAIKYTPPGGRVTLRAEGKEADMYVTVSDTGLGIPPDQRAHLFDRFYRVEAARSHGDGGAGLGLAMAYEIARWHGGTLAAGNRPESPESDGAGGATFTVRLPVHPTAAWEAPQT